MANPSEKRAVVLLSGGLDSLTCLAVARHEGYAPYPISFDYGQKHRSELNAAEVIAQHYRVPLKIIELHSLGNLGGSALTDQRISVKDYDGKAEIPATYVPARNIVFLSVALGYAEIIGAEAIYIGVNAIDYSGYPDCRPEFIQAFQKMSQLGTKAGVEGHGVKILSPLQTLSKSEIINLGHSLKVDYSLSVSCYRATEQGEACGTCDSCHFRRQGFQSAGLPDPTRYSK